MSAHKSCMFAKCYSGKNFFILLSLIDTPPLNLKLLFLYNILLNILNDLLNSKIVVFWPSTPAKNANSKVMHRKEGTHSNGSYERKLCGRKLADEMGRGKKFPWYTHRLMHQKRVTCELHDSYFPLNDDQTCDSKDRVGD